MKKSGKSKKSPPPDQCSAPAEPAKKPVAKSAPGVAGSVMEFPHFLRILGPKHFKIALAYLPSCIIYSITSMILITYMAEWKSVLQFLPYYNGKYEVVETKTAAVKEEDPVEENNDAGADAAGDEDK